jgi:hypothetical protein
LVVGSSIVSKTLRPTSVRSARLRPKKVREKQRPHERPLLTQMSQLSTLRACFNQGNNMRTYSNVARRRTQQGLRRPRLLRLTGPRFINGRRSKRMTAVWTLRARRLSSEVIA